MTRSIARKFLVLGALAGLTTFVGCDSSGSTPTTEKSTAPPITTDNVKEQMKNMNAQRGGMGPGGVAAPAPKKQP